MAVCLLIWYAVLLVHSKVVAFGLPLVVAGLRWLPFLDTYMNRVCSQWLSGLDYSSQQRWSLPFGYWKRENSPVNNEVLNTFLSPFVACFQPVIFAESRPG